MFYLYLSQNLNALTPRDILRKYWQHDDFRPLQADIIDSVLSGRDTLALLPTGGGKSICFQIPALMGDSICLVISPLIALMRDQVENLRQRGIPALALTGGISQDEIGDLLDNVKFGPYRFLYLSPERLQNDWIVERLAQLPVSLIAIDEAHCVSQWGHDFRPAYLKIASLRSHFRDVPFIALTATATGRVQEDIATQLQLETPTVFKGSFARPNIGYHVLYTEDKFHKIVQVLEKNPEPSILYVRNRKGCSELAERLTGAGFTATFYHGGLPIREKEKRMTDWMSGKARAMVATNAFGMGIDKADVRTVIHVELPENLENYYQEAGRAGRAGEKAFAILLVAPADAQHARSRFLGSLPDRDFLLKAYVKLCNYLQVAYGEGPDEVHPFSLNRFCAQYGFPVAKTYNALQFLDREGVLTFSQEFSEKVTMRFLLESREVIRYASLNPAHEPVLDAVLRTYPGIYETAASLNLSFMARKTKQAEADIIAILEKMQHTGLIELHRTGTDASILFHEVREDERTINRISRHLEKQNTVKKKQLEAVIDYTADDGICRSQKLLGYFGETAGDCGQCAACLSRNKANAGDIPQRILSILAEGGMTSRDIEKKTGLPPDALIFALRRLLGDEKIRVTADNRYILNS